MEIKKTNSVNPSICCLIIGLSGVGKTTLAGTLKGRTIIVSAEAGLLSLADKQIDYIELIGDSSYKLDQLRKALSFITKSDYENIFFDSISEISELFLDMANKEFPDQRQSYQKWGLYNAAFKEFVKYIRDIKKNVFCTSLQKTDTDELNRRYYAPDIVGSMALKIPAFFDIVMTMRVVKKENEDIRVLQTYADTGYMAKDRSNKLDKFERPNLQTILDKIGGVYGINTEEERNGNGTDETSQEDGNESKKV